MAKTTRGLIDLYLKDNYENDISMLSKFIQRKYKGKFKNNEISDIYHDSVIRVINSKTYQQNKIKDLHAFIWITLRNEIVRVLVKKKVVIEDSYDINQLEYYDVDNYYENIGFSILMEDLKKELTQQEYWILVNYIYNKLSYKQISVIIGYSKQYVYCKNKNILKKIKELINENRDDYF